MTSLVLLAARLPCGKVVGRRLDRLSVNQLALADDDDILGTCETGRHFDPDPVVDIRRDTDLVSHTLVSITTDIDDGVWVEVTSGLTGAEDVVVVGKSQLVDGKPAKASPYNLPSGKPSSQKY